jgi:hypothetical protein
MAEIRPITCKGTIAELARIYGSKFDIDEKAARLVIDRAINRGCTLQNAKDIAASLSSYCGRHVGIDEVAPVKSYEMTSKLLEETFVAAKKDLEKVSYSWDTPTRELEAAARVCLPALLAILQSGLKQPGLVEKDEMIRYGLWLQEVSWTAPSTKSIHANKMAGDTVESISSRMLSTQLSVIAEHLFYHNDFRDLSQFLVFGISVAPIASHLAKLSCIKADRSLAALENGQNKQNNLGFGEQPEEMRVYQLAQNYVANLHREKRITGISKRYLSELRTYCSDARNVRHHLRAELQYLQFGGNLSKMIECLELAGNSKLEKDVFAEETLRIIHLNLWALNGRESGNETLVEETISLPNLRWLLLRDKTILLPVTWRFIVTELAQRRMNQTWLNDLLPPSIGADQDNLSQRFPLLGS